MKSRCFDWLFRIVNCIIQLFIFKKPRVFVYTDSRGYDVLGRFGKNAWTSYIKRLVFKYRIDFSLCREKYTTIVDFLIKVNSIDVNKYDIIVMHCGVVDFSPRPLSNIEKVKQSKEGVSEFDKIFSDANHFAKPMDTKYMGESTITLYSTTYLEKVIIPQLLSIPNLIWIDSNHFVKGWEGNFAKGRPANIEEVVSKYDGIMHTHIDNTLSLKQWDEEYIRLMTIDNIHFTKQGFSEIAKLLDSKIKKVLKVK